MPRVPDQGGPRLAHPQLVTITFADDADRATLEAFDEWVVGSSWLTTVGAEYGVGQGSVLGVVERPERAPDQIDDDGIAALLAQGLLDGTIPRATSGDPAGALYMVYFPAHTQVNQGTASQPILSCAAFAAYHSSARRAGLEFSYAVMASCPMPYVSLTSVQGREAPASHELIEAATDPLPLTNPGFALRDSAEPWTWYGAEVADLCHTGLDSEFLREGAFVAVRSWSNRIAGAHSGDPCVPADPGAGYFNVSPSPSTRQRAAAGATIRYTLTGWSTAPVADWQVVATASGGFMPTMRFGAPSLNDGRSTTLDVTVPPTALPGSTARVYLWSLHGLADAHLWPLVITAGDACGNHHGCDDCTAQPGCGWCGAASRCELAGRDGSAEGQCGGADWAQWAGACPGFCASHGGSCGDCAARAGCGWCSAGGTTRCLPASTSGAQSADGTCAGADWSFRPAFCPDGG